MLFIEYRKYIRLEVVPPDKIIYMVGGQGVPYRRHGGTSSSRRAGIADKGDFRFTILFENGTLGRRILDDPGGSESQGRGGVESCNHEGRHGSVKSCSQTKLAFPKLLGRCTE